MEYFSPDLYARKYAVRMDMGESALGSFVCPTGGYATAEWLEQNLSSYLDKAWKGGDSPEEVVTDAFLKVGPCPLASCASLQMSCKLAFRCFGDT